MKDKELKTIDILAQKMIEKAKEEKIELVWDRFESQQPQCGFGQLGICCRNCNMGPCRIDPFGDEPQKGVCGATADTIVARNIARMIAAGAAAHSDHGRDIVETLELTAMREAQGYEIKDDGKLHHLCEEYGISLDGKDKQELAKELALEIMKEYGMIKGKLQFADRAPDKRKELWKKLGVLPRGVDREIVEVMHRTHMGVDADYVNILLHGVRTALSDGWGGSMIATELSDVLFGTPEPVESTVNLGVLKEDMVNIVVHGHNPLLSEMIVKAASEKGLIELSKQNGAKGINVVGMCCTGNELLMRKGIPVAGNFLNQELAVITGVVEAMIVDYQCIMPSLPDVAKCYHTKIISTAPKAKFPGTEYVEFDERRAVDIAKKIVKIAVDNFPNRIPTKVMIPGKPVKLVAGFSVEAILKALGGTPQPLIDAIVAGKIRGAVGAVGCNNPKIPHDYGHVELVKKLIKNNILVVTTGCNAIATAKAGLLLPEAAELAGDGLKEICKALGIPPVLHMGSCVDNSRILVLLAGLAKTLKVDVSDLPVAGAAPEWMSEKAVSIGTYVISSGVFTVLGTIPPVLGSLNVTNLLTKNLDGVIGASFAVEPDPEKASQLIIDHIEKKREALGLSSFSR